MSQLYDAGYYVPAFEVVIDGKKLKPEVQKSISTITVTKKIDQADHFSFEVQDEFNNGKFKWLGKDPFKYGKPVSIKMGYVGKTTLTMKALIDKISPKFMTGAIPTFTVEGIDKSFSLLKEKSEQKTYVNKKDSDIVKAIASEVGLSTQVDTTSGEPEAEKKKNGGTSNLDFIRNLVKDNEGFEFFITDGKLYFRKTGVSESAALTLEWGKHLVSFDPQLNVADLATEVIVRSWNEKDKKKIEGKAVAGNERKQESGKKMASQIAKEIFGNKVKVITDQPMQDDAEAKKLAISVLEESSRNFITGSGTTVGIPDLKPGICVELKNLGEWFSGKYYVVSTVHTIDTSGYKTTFNTRRNAL